MYFFELLNSCIKLCGCGEAVYLKQPSEEKMNCCMASESFSISSVACEYLKAKCGAGILALYASVPL